MPSDMYTSVHCSLRATDTCTGDVPFLPALGSADEVGSAAGPWPVGCGSAAEDATPKDTDAAVGATPTDAATKVTDAAEDAATKDAAAEEAATKDAGADDPTPKDTDAGPRPADN